jgi:glycosyltransferase involved in cell wall biosynthesis
VRIDPVSEKTLEKRLARIKEGHPLVIGLIGTLDHKLKGVHDAIKALAILRKRTGKPFVFRHLGPGESAGYELLARKEGLSDIVQFDGMVPSGEAVLDWLDGVDLYIQPSYQEGVPRAVIEGMSRGCPVIGSTAGGIPELLPDLWLHKPGDYQMLAGLMQKILEDETVQENMARRNFALAKTFTSDVLMPKRRAFWGGFRDYIWARENSK